MAGARWTIFLHVLFWLMSLFYVRDGSLSESLVVSPRLLLALSRSEPREFSSRGCLRAGKLLLRGLDRPLTGARGSNDDRALAAAEKLFVSGNFIDEAHAIARHLFLSHPAIDNYCLPIL